MVCAKQLTFHDLRMHFGGGGPRPGAGRPRGPHPQTPHRRRAAIPDGSGSSPPLPEVAPPRTWLLRVGWRRHGLISGSEVPELA